MRSWQVVRLMHSTGNGDGRRAAHSRGATDRPSIPGTCIGRTERPEWLPARPDSWPWKRVGAHGPPCSRKESWKDRGDISQNSPKIPGPDYPLCGGDGRCHHLFFGCCAALRVPRPPYEVQKGTPEKNGPEDLAAMLAGVLRGLETGRN